MHPNKEYWIIRSGMDPYGQPFGPDYSPELGAKLYEARSRGMVWRDVCSELFWPNPKSRALVTAGAHAKRYAYDNRLPWPINVPTPRKYHPRYVRTERSWISVRTDSYNRDRQKEENERAALKEIRLARVTAPPSDRDWLILFPKAVRQGRPIIAPSKPGSKQAVTLRISRDVLDKFRESGNGWQARMDDALRKAVGL